MELFGCFNFYFILFLIISRFVLVSTYISLLLYAYFVSAWVIAKAFPSLAWAVAAERWEAGQDDWVFFGFCGVLFSLGCFSMFCLVFFCWGLLVVFFFFIFVCLVFWIWMFYWSLWMASCCFWGSSSLCFNGFSPEFGLFGSFCYLLGIFFWLRTGAPHLALMHGLFACGLWQLPWFSSDCIVCHTLQLEVP